MKTITVALDKLDTDPKNVRKTYTEDGLNELAQHIRATGNQLLQNLVVRKSATKGRYLVSAGERRRRALLILAEAGELDKTTYMVECKLMEVDEVTEVSLIENIARENMHPADQYDAFKAMAEAGKPIADIAAKFDVSERIVKQRLALASVSPVLIDLYRNEQMDLTTLQAFTVCDDHARQEQVWASLPTQQRRAYYIKDALNTSTMSLTDPLFKYVTREVYEAAGGEIVRDLFDDQNGGFATDVALIEQLAMQRLETIAEPIRAEGWKWVSVHPKRPDGFYQLTRVYPEIVSRELTDEEQAELELLSLEYDELALLIENNEDPKAEQRVAEIEARQKELNATTEIYTDEQKARAGVIVHVSHTGDLEITYGVISAEDAKAEKAANATASNASASNSNEPLHSAALLQELTAQKTAIIRAELANNPHIALVTVVHAMLLRAFFQNGYGQTCLELRLSSEQLENHIKDRLASKAMRALDTIANGVLKIMPQNPAELWSWCLERSENQLLELLAVAASITVNVVESANSSKIGEAAHGNKLALALNIDMTTWFEPTADNYFGRLNKTGIEKALTEAKSADLAAGIAQMKKAEAAAYAADHIKGSGWLPVPLRVKSADPVAVAAENEDVQEAAE